MIKEFLFAISRYPNNTNQMFSTVLKHVKCLINSPFLVDKLLVDLYVREVILIVVAQIVEKGLF